MRRLGLSLASAALALTLSACSGEDAVKDAAEGVGLQAGDEGAVDPLVPTEAPPVAPIDTLVKDLSTPSGLGQAYMNYLQLGDGLEVCNLFTDTSLERYYESVESCRNRVEDYAESVLYAFEDRLDVADGLTVRVTEEKPTSATVGIAARVNEEEGVSFYESIEAQKVGQEWRIVSVQGMNYVEQSTDAND